MELEKIDINGLNDIYALSVVQKEFTKSVNEQWKSNPPWQRYQKKLIQDLAVLDMVLFSTLNDAPFFTLNGAVLA